MKITAFRGLDHRSDQTGPSALVWGENVTILPDGSLGRRPGLRRVATIPINAVGLTVMRDRPMVVAPEGTTFGTWNQFDVAVVSDTALVKELHGALLSASGRTVVLVTRWTSNGGAERTELHVAAVNHHPTENTKVDLPFSPAPLGVVKSGSRACLLDASGRFLRYSAVDNPNDVTALTKWTPDGTDSGPGQLEIGQHLSKSLPTGITEWNGRVVIFTATGALVVRIATDQISHVVEGQIYGVGCTNHHSIVVAGSDAAFIGSAGIRSLSQTGESQATAESGLGGAVDELAAKWTRRMVSAAYDCRRGIAVWCFAGPLFADFLVLARPWGGDGESGWTHWRVTEFGNAQITATSEGLFVRRGDELYQFDDSADKDETSSIPLDIPVMVEPQPFQDGVDWSRVTGAHVLLSGDGALGQVIRDGRPPLDEDGTMLEDAWAVTYRAKWPEWSQCVSYWPGRRFSMRIWNPRAAANWRLRGIELAGIASKRRGPT